MTTVNSSSSLSSMLALAFQRVDQSQDGQLNADEFSSFHEVLKAGIAVDDEGTPVISENEYFNRMDHDRNGQVDESEMQSTGVLMPAELTDDSLDAMIKHLLEQATKKSAEVAALLAKDETAALGSAAQAAPKPVQ